MIDRTQSRRWVVLYFRVVFSYSNIPNLYLKIGLKFIGYDHESQSIYCVIFFCQVKSIKVHHDLQMVCSKNIFNLSNRLSENSTLNLKFIEWQSCLITRWTDSLLIDRECSLSTSCSFKILLLLVLKTNFKFLYALLVFNRSQMNIEKTPNEKSVLLGHWYLCKKSLWNNVWIRVKASFIDMQNQWI